MDVPAASSVTPMIDGLMPYMMPKSSTIQTMIDASAAIHTMHMPKVAGHHF